MHACQNLTGFQRVYGSAQHVTLGSSFLEGGASFKANVDKVGVQLRMRLYKTTEFIERISTDNVLLTDSRVNRLHCVALGGFALIVKGSSYGTTGLCASNGCWCGVVRHQHSCSIE